MSDARPIHQIDPELCSQPDDAEPSFSYEQESFLVGAKEEDVEDEFHRRLQSSRRDSGGSFWRTSSSSAEFAGPNFSSMSMKQRQDSTTSVSERKTSGRLGVALQMQTPEQNDSNKSAKKIKDSGVATKESKKYSKQRSRDRINKMDAHNSELDLGHLEEETSAPLLIPPTEGSVSRSSSDHSGSLLYGKNLHPPRNGVLLGKSSSLIFPTGVEAPGAEEAQKNTSKTREINLRLDQCETVRWPMKKKLNLENMQLSAAEIPVSYLFETPLGNTLYKLSLAKNRLSTVPAKLVQCLPILKHLDLSQCELVTLPEKWDLPQLKKLNLSHNKLTDFPDEAMLEGIPELQDLNMYGNKVSEIVVPRNSKLLSKLEILNLGYNDLAFLPDDLDQIKSLRILKVMNNFLEKVPMRVCEMDIKTIDVSSNPVVQPPVETCERGICSMKRYYHCLRQEAQSKHKALEEVQKKLLKHKKREEKKKFPKKIPRFFSTSIKSNSSISMSSDKSFTEEGNSQSLHSTSEEPSVLPSKVESRGLGRTRSISFDEAMAIREDADGDDEMVGGLKAANSSMPDVEILQSALAGAVSEEVPLAKPEDAVVNDTLKVIFVGMAMAGKTSMIKRLIEGRDAVIPQSDDRTIGVDIYEWDPHNNKDRPHVDTRIDIEDKAVSKDVDVKFSVWDFAGQHVYHATHELFFSPHALYVVVWDMGSTNQSTHRQKTGSQDRGAFSLGYDSSDEEDDDDFIFEEEGRRADRALERDIDEKVQFWVECIQSCAPGAAILPVASFDDYFDNEEEAKRRCNILQQRLKKHEERRIAGIKERLEEYTSENRANDEAAHRLRKLMCSYTRPKIIFGGENDSVVRVSGTEYTGFDRLTQRIVQLATGREKAGYRYPIFRGHVGARIPRMRIEVRDAVREMRDKFKVVEWGYFTDALRKRGLTNVEDISDALHFLTNTGELSYFGIVLADRQKVQKMGDSEVCKQRNMKMDGIDNSDEFVVVDDDDDLDDDLMDYEDAAVVSIDDTSLTAPSSQGDGSLSTFDEFNSSSLSQYVFLNPRWLVAAVACILRHDLDREIRETRRSFATESRVDSVYEGNLNCPVITAEDALMLWQAKKFTKKAADRAQEYSNNMKLTPFIFLQRLLIRFGVFVPIDLSIEKAFLGGKEYAKAIGDASKPPAMVIEMEQGPSPESHFFFLPSLLGPGEPAEAWTYKNTDSWKTTLCHSVLFPDGVPPGLMERITAAVLSTVYAVSKGCELIVHSPFHAKKIKTLDGPLRVKEILCWRTAFFLKVGTEVKNDKGEVKESVVEIFAHLVDRESHLCVGSDSMGAGMRRLVISAKGQVGDGGRKIWNGGYLLVLKSAGKIMAEYGGLEYEKQAFCPECISKMSVSEASSWNASLLREASRNGESTMRCNHGHRIDTRLVTGPIDSLSKVNMQTTIPVKFNDSDPAVPVNDLLRSIVLVGLWDGKARKVVRVGSGFIVDKKRGLIVTASHTLMNIWGDKSSPFGENYYGLRDGKVVIGIIPKQKEGDRGTEAVFRYFAKIVAKDPSIDEKGECHLDACVLRITTRMETDVFGNGDGCGDQPEILLLNNPDALKREKLQPLKVTDKCELDEQVRILGFNQGGEGLLGPGERLNRYVDFARGYVCKKFATQAGAGYLRHRFKPHKEIVVICPTIGGHSGGPCVNQKGEVIGILSRADPAEKQRCYLVPSYEWKDLVKRAKNSY